MINLLIAAVISISAPQQGACAKSACCCNSQRQPNISVFSDFLQGMKRSRGMTLAQAGEWLYDLGIRGFDCSVFDRDLPELAATKLKPINLYYFAKFNTPDKGAAKNKLAIETAVKYGVPRIMTIPPSFTDGGDEEAEFVQNTAILKQFVADAKAKGITITVEDFGGDRMNCCSSMKYLKRMLDEIPDLRFALDSGNLYYAGRGEDILEMMAYAKDRIAHVHLKDQTKADSHKYATLGLGAVPNEKIVKETWKNGYNGWYTLENTVGEPYIDTVRQVNVLKAWISGR